MAKSNFSGVILYWPPPLQPRVRTDAKPTLVRSEISARSNLAKAEKMTNTCWPSGVLVLMEALCPVNPCKPTPLLVCSCTVLMRWCKLRPRRSSFHTSSVSPDRNAFNQLMSPGRASRLPDAKSWSVCSSPMPAASNAYLCMSKTWEPSALKTRQSLCAGFARSRLSSAEAVLRSRWALWSCSVLTSSAPSWRNNMVCGLHPFQ